MDIDVRDVDGALIVRPHVKRLTATNGAHEFRAAIHKAIKGGYKGIGIDFTDVEFVDNAVQNVLITEFKWCIEKHGLMCIYAASQEIREFYHQIILDQLIPVCDDKQAALQLLEDHKKQLTQSRFWTNWHSQFYVLGYRLRIVPDRRKRDAATGLEVERRKGAVIPAETAPTEPAPATTAPVVEDVAVLYVEPAPLSGEAHPAPETHDRAGNRVSAKQEAEEQELLLPLDTKEEIKPKAPRVRRAKTAPITPSEAMTPIEEPPRPADKPVEEKPASASESPLETKPKPRRKPASKVPKPKKKG